jgi:hypothetical protein
VGKRIDKVKRKLREGRGPVETLSDDLRKLLDVAGGQPITLGEILKTCELRGEALLLVVFAFPLCLPIGITAIFGPVLVFVSFFILLRKPIWLPRRLARHEVSFHTLQSVSTKLLRFLGPIERRLKFRLAPLSSPLAIRIHGLYILILSLIVSIPMPIFLANTVAALPVLILGMGLLKRDGLVIAAAYVAVIPCVMVYGGLAALGWEGVEWLIHWFG